MDSKIVVGVGNIYAQEALFMAGINPNRVAGKISKPRYELLVKAIKKILKKAIKAGGTSLKDFVNANGQPGYFRFNLQVYARDGEPCVKCESPLIQKRISQRSTVYCGHCQT